MKPAFSEPLSQRVVFITFRVASSDCATKDVEKKSTLNRKQHINLQPFKLKCLFIKLKNLLKSEDTQGGDSVQCLNFKYWRGCVIL